MGFQIISGLPFWFVMLCLAMGAAVAAILYFRNKTSGFSKSLVILLAVLRFISFSLIAFLLLSPLIKTIGRSTEKPTVVIGVDNSSSMFAGNDSLFLSSDLPKFYEQLKSGLANNFEVRFYTFGQDVVQSDKPDFKDAKTDISSFISSINTEFYNRNLGAMVLLSDGIYNAGENPLYALRNSMYPVFTVKFGDTTVKRDLIISGVNHNRYAYKGNRFPVEVKVHAREAAGASTNLTVYQDGKEIFSRPIKVSSANQVFTIPFFIEAGETGLKKYSIALEAIPDEINTTNNRREIFVEIKEMRQKVALVAASPHPDLAALKRALENSNNYQVDLFMAADFNAKVTDYSLFILHQLPSAANQSNRLTDEIIKNKIPVLFILGSQSDLSRLNQFKTGLTLSGFNQSTNEALPMLNKDFPLFMLSTPMEKLFAVLPPLISPFANYQISNATYILAYQKLGQAITNIPLIAFTQTAEVRYGIIAGEGIWKWRMQDFATNATHQTFDDLINKTVQYLSQPGDKGNFRLYWNNYYAENEPVDFSARLYNDTDEPITGPEVEMQITNEDGKEFNYSFTTNGLIYQLSAGSLPAGLYSFKAQTDPGTGVVIRSGNFVVSPLNLEDVNTVANHRLLNAMASETGGTSFVPADVQKIIEVIKNREDIKPVVYSKKRYTDLVDFFPLLMLIILLMGVEWFLRKFHGSY